MDGVLHKRNLSYSIVIVSLWISRYDDDSCISGRHTLHAKHFMTSRSQQVFGQTQQRKGTGLSFLVNVFGGIAGALAFHFDAGHQQIRFDLPFVVPGHLPMFILDHC